MNTDIDKKYKCPECGTIQTYVEMNHSDGWSQCNMDYSDYCHKCHCILESNGKIFYIEVKEKSK